MIIIQSNSYENDIYVRYDCNFQIILRIKISIARPINLQIIFYVKYEFR